MFYLGERLRISRDAKGVTQIQTSKDIKINNKTLSGYERNVSEPDFDTIKVLAEYYDVSLDYLMGKSNIKNPYNQVPGRQARRLLDKEITALDLPNVFKTPEEAIKFILEQNVIMSFGGFDIDKLTDDEIVEFANSLLEHLKLLSLKYRK